MYVIDNAGDIPTVYAKKKHTISVGGNTYIEKKKNMPINIKFGEKYVARKFPSNLNK